MSEDWPENTSWEVLSSEYVLEHPVTVVKERVKTHTGQELDYVYRPGPVQAVFVLPILQMRPGSALMIRQYRHPISKFLLEVPAGKVDAGENLEEAARRELLEETGAVAQELIAFPAFYPQSSFAAVTFHPFLALGVEVVQPPDLEAGELLHSARYSLETLYQKLEGGEIQDGPTMLALFYAKPLLQARGWL